MSSNSENECALFSIIQTSSVHQYVNIVMRGSCAECDAELQKRDPDSRFGLKVARIEDLHLYRS